jgi:hypothetical protein
MYAFWYTPTTIQVSGRNSRLLPLSRHLQARSPIHGIFGIGCKSAVIHAVGPFTCIHVMEYMR